MKKYLQFRFSALLEEIPELKPFRYSGMDDLVEFLECLEENKKGRLVLYEFMQIVTAPHSAPQYLFRLKETTGSST